jgi:hypothetical protein
MSQLAVKSSHSASYKEVRFSQPLVPIRRARSIASSNPLLDPAHQAAGAAQKALKEKTYSEYAVYINQSRSLLESQRLNFERERLVFAEERKLWDMERAMLKARIAELETAAGSVNTQPHKSFFNPDYSLQSKSSSSRVYQADGSPTANGQKQEHHVWEGPIPGSRRPTRVFPADDVEGNANLYISPTEANGFGLRTSLDAALSPQLFDRSVEISVMSVPIEKLDSRLDGITLKSTALPLNVVAKVMTPPTSLSPASSPSKDEPATSDGKSPSPLKLKLEDLARPHENLIRDAGHTPMAILGTETDVSRQSPGEAELSEGELAEEETPLAPVVTKQPVENSDSYFPAVVEDDDPALKGPLTLLNSEQSDVSFLSQLDQKLLDEAKKAVSRLRRSASEADDGDAAEGGNEPDPELKLKASTNFGTAFGQC